MMMRTDHPSFRYAKAVLEGSVDAPKYVVIQCWVFLEIAEDRDPVYRVSKKKLKQIDRILKLLIMPKGLAAGKSVYAASVGYQWLLYVSVLCVVFRDDPSKRRYEYVVLEIARKNFKTYTVAVILILLMLTEPEYSRFFSVAPDGSLSREVKGAIVELIKASPFLYPPDNPGEYFKIRRDDLLCKINDNTFVPLNYSSSRLDGKLPTAFVVDEVGALPNNYAIEAMASGQLTIQNKLGFVISTKYPKFQNPFETEVQTAKLVLDGTLQNNRLFALLYEPDNPEAWATDDSVLRHANPAAIEVPGIMEDLLIKRDLAIAVESKRENFLTKHCNILYQGIGTETFVAHADVERCRAKAPIVWAGRDVYLGVDLAMTNDNCAVAMSADDEGEILADVIAFIPEGRKEEKSKVEHLDYDGFIRELKCIACGDRTVDYAVIEDFVFDVEETYGVRVMGIGFDRMNAMSSAQRWERGRDGSMGYTTVIVRQHSDTLHPATKLLSEKMENGQFHFAVPNTLLEVNFENARCTYDTNMNRYVNKRRSIGKVDMVVALIISVYMLQQAVYLDGESWGAQVI